MLFGMIVLAIFNTVNYILTNSFHNVEFGLSFGFWGLCICFIIYLIPYNKKREKREVKD